MIATNPSAAPVLLALSNTLREVTKELANLSAVQEAPKPHNRIAHLTTPKAQPKTVPRIPTQSIAARLHNPRAAELVKREEAKVAKTPKAAKAKKLVNHLSAEAKADIGLLLSMSNLSVIQIADLYKVSRPTVYNLRDKMAIKTHRGSPELMAGIKRYKAEKAKAARQEPAPTPAPAAEVAPVAETPVAATV